MATFKKEKLNSEIPDRRREKSEFGKGTAGIIVCDTCGAAYFKKRWYHGLEKISSKNPNHPVSFKLCPACTMISNRQFEGRITLKNVPEKYESEITNFAHAYGRRAWERDPMDRLIAIKKTNGELVITTTENQLANKLARKLKQMFRKTVKDISFSPSPSDVVYVTITFTTN